MIDADSILRRLPRELDPKQALFLDGIRHAGEIASLAYNRLKDTLTLIALKDLGENKETPLYTQAFLDAWALVDVIDRFRMLWKLFPNPRENTHSSAFCEFEESAQQIRALRNVADHLAQRAEYVVACKGSALGSLSWFTMVEADGSRGVICIIVPGTIQNMSQKLVNPIGHQIVLPTDLIHLEAGEYSANLSKTYLEIANCIKLIEEGLEKSLAEAGLKGKQAGADLLMKVVIE